MTRPRGRRVVQGAIRAAGNGSAPRSPRAGTEGAAVDSRGRIRAVRVAIDGVDAAGKTTLDDGLAPCVDQLGGP